MRILITHHQPLEGAFGRSLRNLAAGLVQAGHEVLCLVVESSPGQTEGPIAVERIVCRSGDAAADLPFELPALGPDDGTALEFDDLSDAQLTQYRDTLRRRLDQCVERFNPHLIHCQAAWLFAHLALESGAPYVVTVQGPELATIARGERYRRFAEEAVENASRVLVHNRAAAEELRALFPEGTERLLHIPPPIGTQAQPSATPPRDAVLKSLHLPGGNLPLVACPAHLAPDENIPGVLNAQAVLAARGQAIALVLCGDGPQRAELEAQARHQQLPDVYFTGPLPAQERSRLLAIADAAVLPSGGWSSFYQALEALACGTPVVAAGREPLAEVVDQRVGELVEPNDHELLAEALHRSLDEHWKASKGPHAAQYVASHYSVTESVRQHLACYRDALDQRYGKGNWEQR